MSASPKPNNGWNSLFGIVLLAAVGLVLVWLPGKIASQYAAIKDLGFWWVTAYFTVVGLGAAILLFLLGSTGWTLWRREIVKRRRQKQGAASPSELSPAEQSAEYQENIKAVTELQGDAAVPADVRDQLKTLADDLETKRQTQRLEIVAFGTISSGKSSLLNALAGRDVFNTDLKGGTTIQRQEIPWTGADQVFLVDTPGLAEVDGAKHATVAAEAAQDADIVLVVVDGPLRDSEFQLLQTLAQMEKKVLICLNKEDWYGDRDKADLMGQITRQAKAFADEADVIAVRSQVTQRRRVRVLPSGEEVEEFVPVSADIAPLAERMLKVVKRDGHDLLLANLLLQSRGLVEEARQRVTAALDEQAWSLVNRYAWTAGGAAALSPFPIVDLIAGSAISTKMIVDLAPIYKQQMDLQAGKKMLEELGRNLVGWLGVTMAAPAVTMAVGSLLKTVPLAGHIAGGTLQGLTQALVTRWIGAVFIEYFKNEMKAPEGGLAGLALREWKKLTSLSELSRFVSEARERMSAK